MENCRKYNDHEFMMTKNQKAALHYFKNKQRQDKIKYKCLNCEKQGLNYSFNTIIHNTQNASYIKVNNLANYTQLGYGVHKINKRVCNRCGSLFN